jgi:ATP-binding cassette subfamily A (ABC1) protein 3
MLILAIILATGSWYLHSEQQGTLSGTCRSTLLLLTLVQLGLGSTVPVYKLADVFPPSNTLIYIDATNGTDSLAVLALMTIVMRDFTPAQKNAVVRLDSEAELQTACPHSFQLVSNCYGAVVFKSANTKTPVQYTLRADIGRIDVDVLHHTSDAEVFTLPLQWAIDSAIIELVSGVQMSPPNQWPFTKMTNGQTKQKTRKSALIQTEYVPN